MKRFFLVVGLVVALGSCYNDKSDKLYPTPVTTVDLCDTITNPAKFSTSVGAICVSRCATAGCHDASTMQSGYAFTTHTADSSASARITARVSDGTMPPASAPQLTTCEKAQVYYWLHHGSLNN